MRIVVSATMQVTSIKSVFCNELDQIEVHFSMKYILPYDTFLKVQPLDEVSVVSNGLLMCHDLLYFVLTACINPKEPRVLCPI